jgi:hypothetical protein
MHHDAELAVIRVGGGGVDVSHLHQRQQSQQNQAQSRGGDRKCAPAAICAVWLESVQKDVTPFFQGYTELDATVAGAFPRRSQSPAYLLDMRSSKM